MFIFSVRQQMIHMTYPHKSPRREPTNVNVSCAATVSPAVVADVAAWCVSLFSGSAFQTGSARPIGPAHFPHEASLALMWAFGQFTQYCLVFSDRKSTFARNVIPLF